MANEDISEIELILTITDQVIFKHLNSFPENIRNAKALEALKIGVIAIQSASPFLDTKIVDEKFREVQNSINENITTFKSDLKEKLEEFFKNDSGLLHRSLENFFGNNGEITQMMNSYFKSDNGTLHNLINNQVGPQSNFAKSLDPNNKESVISRIETSVKDHLQSKTAEIMDQFSLDKENSALSRLQKTLFEKVNEIQQSNNAYHAQLSKVVGIQEGKQTESEKGTEKGKIFEDDLYQYVAKVAKNFGDLSEAVGGIKGINNAKVGDYVLTLGETSAAPNSKIVIEAKNAKDYTLKKAIEELNVAKKNREADAGIFVFAKGCEPSEIGDFYKTGNDFFITVDKEQLYAEEQLLFLDSAYKIIRVMLTASQRKKEANEFDFQLVKTTLEEVIKSAQAISDITTKANTIKNNSVAILDITETLKNDIDKKLFSLIEMIDNK